MIRGVLRRGGLAVGGIRGATGYERKGNDGKAGEDDFFHIMFVVLFGCFINHARLGHQLVIGYGV
jgi:hypothetical protein